jgi:hypothetical protein
MMNREELKKLLADEGIFNTNIYGLKGKTRYGLERPLADDQFILDNEGGKWIVYFYEKGKKLSMFSSWIEHEACKYLYDQLHKVS